MINTCSYSCWSCVNTWLLQVLTHSPLLAQFRTSAAILYGSLSLSLPPVFHHSASALSLSLSLSCPSHLRARGALQGRLRVNAVLLVLVRGRLCGAVGLPPVRARHLAELLRHAAR